MNGLELSRAYYEKYGRPMLEAEFPEVLPYLALGFSGSGSEHLGYDDEVSKDHDFEPGFCIFLPEEEIVDRRTAFLLERAYYKLPKEFMGVSRGYLSPVGGNRNGVIRMAEFFTRTVGDPKGELKLDAWLHLPEQALLEATSGEVFADPYGEFTRIRAALRRMPEDVLKKRLAGQVFLMAQTGLYNYPRCLAHGETEAAAMALSEFVKAAMQTAFLLKRTYMPYYKWSFRALRALPDVGTLPEELAFLLSGDLNDPALQQEKCRCLEKIGRETADALRAGGFSRREDNDLERHAYAVNDGIKDPMIRSMHLLECI